MQLVHLVARMRYPHRLFLDRSHAAWMWRRLRQVFPRTVAACLMPNHPHVVALVEDPDAARVALARTCGHLQRRAGIRDLFEPLPPPDLVRPGKEGRVGRYVELNGCRKDMVASPLEHEWSTLRDVVGATAERWVDPALHRRVMGRGARAWFEYVVADERVRDREPLASTLPLDGAPGLFGPAALARAAAAALRADVAEVRRRGPVRRLLFALANDMGVRAIAPLAELTGANEATVWRGLSRPIRAEWLAAARQCLADPRLVPGGLSARNHCVWPL